MTAINVGRSDDEKLLPCDVFDMIGGTSTGGYVIHYYSL